MEGLKKMISESVRIEKFKVTGVEGIYNYKVFFTDEKLLEINFDKMIKKKYVSNPSFKIYLDEKLLDFDNEEANYLYLFTRDIFHNKN